MILSGSHASVYEVDDRRAPHAVFELGVPGAGHLLRHADHGAAAGRQGRKAATPASSATPKCAPTATPRCSKGIARLRHARRPRHAQGVDEPRRQGHRAAARLQADGLHAVSCPIAGMADESAPLLRRAVPPRSHAHRAGPGAAGPLCAATSAAPAPTGSWATTSKKPWPRSASRWVTKR